MELTFSHLQILIKHGQINRTLKFYNYMAVGVGPPRLLPQTLSTLYIFHLSKRRRKRKGKKKEKSLACVFFLPDMSFYFKYTIVSNSKF